MNKSSRKTSDKRPPKTRAGAKMERIAMRLCHLKYKKVGDVSQDKINEMDRLIDFEDQLVKAA